MNTTDISNPRSSDSVLLAVEDVAEMLRCSTRSVYRLADAGKMPRPVRLGALVRWNRASVMDWISKGCPSVVKGTGR